MQCTLHIPHLIAPRHAAPAWDALQAPSLKTLLARAHYKRTAAMDENAQTCELFGVKDAPIAPLLAREDGLAAEDGYWLNATPVHVQTHHHALVLHDPAVLDLTAAQSTALAATLAAHLRDDGLNLHCARPARWYLQCGETPAMTTTALREVVGQDIAAFLPKGADALRWHRLMTELQMLLHTHPVNDARDAAGQLPVNWVWLWGGGRLPAPVPAPFDSVWSDHPLTCAMARHAGVPLNTAPSDLGAISLHEGHHFFSFHALTPLWQRGDLQAWSAAVTTLEQGWFRALGADLRSRKIARVTLLTTNQDATHHFVMGNWDFLKIFNKNKYL